MTKMTNMTNMTNHEPLTTNGTKENGGAKPFAVYDRLKFADRPESARLGPHIQCPGQQFLFTGDRFDPAKLDAEIANAKMLGAPWTLNVERLKSADWRVLSMRPGVLASGMPAAVFNARVVDAVDYIYARWTGDLGFYVAPYDPSDFNALGFTLGQLANPRIANRMSQTWLEGALNSLQAKCEAQAAFFMRFQATWDLFSHIGVRCYVDRLTPASRPEYTQHTAAEICRCFKPLAGQSRLLAYVDLCDQAAGNLLPTEHLAGLIQGVRKHADGVVFYGGRSNRPFTPEFASAIQVCRDALA
jgi:hypothetical protein